MNEQTVPPVEDRRTRIAIPAFLAKALIEEQAKIEKLSTAANALAATQSKMIGAIASDAGHPLDQFERWEFENGKDGVTNLLLTPPPLPIPVPTKPVPQASQEA